MSQAYDKLHLFIAGEWLAVGGRGVQPVRDPANGEVLGELPLASVDDVDRALQAAEDAYRGWRKTAAWDRAAILKRAADLLRERVDAVARLLVLEEGKTLAEACGEVAISADILEWAAEEARRVYGRVIPPRQPGQRQLVLKEPVGPVAAFAPWNFPAITPTRKIAAALAAGCVCILKPAEEAPATALAIARCLEEAGLPKGVLQVVFGIPDEVSRRLLGSPIIRKLSFTGSTAVGRHLAKLAADRVCRSTLELGGHAPVLVFSDANLDGFTQAAVAWKFRNAGQVCTSPTRFYVQEPVFDDVVERLGQAARSLTLGHGLDAASRMGPLANPRRREAIEGLIEDATRRGARLITGGVRTGADAGLFFEATVLADVPQDARIMSQEPFGPVAIVNRFTAFDDAIANANRLPYGLAAYAFTRSADTAVALGDELEAGMVGLNTFLVATPETPFGGMKDSGYGSEGGVEGMDGYLQTKFVNQVSA